MACGLGGKQFRELVFKALALVVGERQVARVAAGAKHIGVDQFERTSLAAWSLCLRNGFDRPQGGEPAAQHAEQRCSYNC